MQEDIWQIKNAQKKKKVKDEIDAVTFAVREVHESQNKLLSENLQDDETAEVTDNYVLSCGVYERGINLLCEREEGRFLMNEYAL